MIKPTILSVVLILVNVVFAHQAWAVEQAVRMHVSGMTCGLCPISVKHRALQMQDVHSASVDIDKAQAIITYEDSEQSPQAIAQVITELGYPTTITGEE